MWYNKDAFEKAGLDPEKPPATWNDVIAACRALKAKSATPVPMGSAWPIWIQFEQFAAMHDLRLRHRSRTASTASTPS
jgi:sn-glycerol 3-phosphate transport system substrate-binding protein